MNRFPHLPPLPLLLYSYLSTEILAPFFASFLIMNSVFFLVKLIPFLNVVLELNISFADFLRLFSYLFPNMFLYSMPMAAMMGMIIAFSRLSSDAEILAFKANGISIYTMLPPVIMVSIAIAAVTGYFSIKLIPTGEIAMKQLMFQLAKEKIDQGIKESAFTEALGDVVVYVQSIDKATGQWQNVWVSDMRDQTVPSITMAKSGTMVGDTQKMQVTIILENGSLNRPDGAYTQTVTFDRYQINIPLHIPSVIDGTDVTQQSSSSMTMAQLQLAATQLGRESKPGRDKLVHYHKRLVLPVGCFILSLLALPLGLQARVGRSAIGIPLGLGCFILYYVLFTVGKNLAEESALPVGIAMWSPNLIFFIFTLILLRQTANEKPLLPTTMCDGCAAFIDRTLFPFMVKIRTAVHLPAKKRSEKPALNMHSYDQTAKELLGVGHLAAGTVHGNAKSRVCHLPECESYLCLDCTLEFKTMEIARQAGFTPCAFCTGILAKQGPTVKEEAADKRPQ